MILFKKMMLYHNSIQKKFITKIYLFFFRVINLLSENLAIKETILYIENGFKKELISLDSMLLVNSIKLFKFILIIFINN